MRITMVMRCGSKKASANQISYICIAEDYSILKLTSDEIVKGIVSKQYIVENMGVVNGKLVSTNGALDKYTLINPQNNVIEGRPSPVVLNRAEVDGKLIGYTIFNTEGVLQEVDVQTALKIHAITPFANGKLRHTNNGDIIQSIEGDYIRRTITIAKKPAENIKVDLVFIGSAIGNHEGKQSIVKYMGILVNGKNAADLARVYQKLLLSNKKVTSVVGKFDETKKASESLRIKRTGNAGIYTVVTIDTAMELIKEAGNRVNNSYGEIMIACTDYTEGVDESILTLDSKLQIKSSKKGSEKSAKELKLYADDIIKKLHGIDIK